MITSLRLQNFKSWKDTGEMRFAPLTGLFGTNSSGKSSILQFLLMLKQTTESAEPNEPLDLGVEGDERDYVQLGSFRELLHRKSRSKVAASLNWTIGWTQISPVPSLSNLYTAEIKDFKVETFRFDLRIKDEMAAQTLIMKRKRNDGTPDTYELYIGEPSNNGAKVQVTAFPSLYKCYGLLGEQRIDDRPPFDIFLTKWHVETFFSQVYYLGPLRDYPRREYRWSGTEPNSVGRRGERTIEALLASMEKELISRNSGIEALTTQEDVAHWLKELGLIHSFSIQSLSKESSLYQVRVRQNANSALVPLTDVGFGVSQILPVLTLLYYVPQGATVILEQPEIHLHPRVQAGLADVLIDAIKTRKIQILLESHSEHLLTRLQRRIAEEKFDANDAALYFTEMVQGASKLMPLVLNEYGNITNWPIDFFGDEFEERAAMMEAIVKRKQRENAA